MEQDNPRILSSSNLHTERHEKITLNVLDSLYVGSKTDLIFLFNKSKSEREMALLKSCLERTLAIYYPYTGSLVDSPALGLSEITWEDASANGAVYEECVEESEEACAQPSFEQEYLGSPHLKRYHPRKTKALAAIRVTNFPKTSAFIIAISLSHAVGDGTTTFNLLTHWFNLVNANAVPSLDDASDSPSMRVMDLANGECVDVFTSRALMETDNLVPIKVDALTYLEKPRGDFYSSFKMPQATYRPCCLSLRSKVITGYRQRALENGVKLSDNDVICAMIFRSYVLADPELCKTADRVVSCGFPINMRGRRKARELPKGYMGNPLVLARISACAGDVVNDTDLTTLGQLFRAESVRWYDSNNLENYLSWLQNTENKEKIFFSMDTMCVVSSWTGFPLYTNKLFGDSPALAGPMFPFPDFENTKFTSTPDGDGVRLYSNVHGWKYDEFQRRFTQMSSEL
jgi:hypothetical protein